MSSKGFSFPPPPPPPPQQQQQQPQHQQYQHHATYPSASPYGQNPHYGQRGGRGGSGGQHRGGRGRGFGQRGGAGRGGVGGHFAASDARQHPGYSANTGSVGYAPMSYPSYPGQSLPTHTPTPNFPQTQYQTSQSAGFQHQHQHQPPQAAFASPIPPYQQHQQPNYNAGYNASTTTQPATNYPAPHQQASAQPQPPMMGPPIRWGFESNPSFPGSGSGSFPPSQRGHGHGHGHARGPRAFNQGNKRDHTSAFGKPQSSGPRTPAPPAVPSFGNPLPSKPPVPAEATRKPKKKKKRQHNQLGLTPKTEEYESSEEEDDVDEEARLALGEDATTGGGALQVTYRGRTSTLQTPTDIAAWIEERRKRFPTQAKIEEKKKAMEEAKKARDEALKQKESQRKQESKRVQKEKQKSTDPVDVAEKAKQKADKLRRKLMKEQKRVEKAEADAEQARLKAEALQKKTVDHDPDVPEPSGQGLPVEGEAGQPQLNAPAVPEQPVLDDIVEVSSVDSANGSDWTSSSGSELSLSDSDESQDDNDSAPEEASSRREGPERVPPPPREGAKKKQACRHFLRTGRCIRGDKCRFSHDAPERGGGKTKPPVEKPGRKGLLQSLLDRQKEDETRKVMEAITWLGENGMLQSETPDTAQPPDEGIVGTNPN